MNKSSKIKERLHHLRKVIDETALSAGRAPSEIALIAVSKGHTVESILEAYEAGCRDIGESRVQETCSKLPFLPKDLCLHLIGTLQKNKVAQAIKLYSMIHSVDSILLAEQISNASMKNEVVTPILIQVNTSGEATKHGLTPEGWEPFLEKLLEMKGIQLDGLMTIGPHTMDEARIRRSFASLRNLQRKWQASSENESLFRHLSMGMSSDFQIAIQEGATLLRIGSAIFGQRI